MFEKRGRKGKKEIKSNKEWCGLIYTCEKGRFDGIGGDIRNKRSLCTRKGKKLCGVDKFNALV